MPRTLKGTVIEDEIRNCEAAKDFGPRFIDLTRAVYQTTDRRAGVKKQIDKPFGSPVERPLYPPKQTFVARHPDSDLRMSALPPKADIRAVIYRGG